MLDSSTTPPTRVFIFPFGMLFTKQLTVAHTEQVSHDTTRITFALPGGRSQVSGVPPGDAILTQHTPAGSWCPVFRPYTPVSDPNEPGLLRIIVKRYPNGKASNHLHSLRPGDPLTVRCGIVPGYGCPWSGYTPCESPRDLIFLAGGAGITPLYSLSKGILSDPSDRTRIQLLWGVNGIQDIVLKNELDELEKQYPDRLRVAYTVSRPQSTPESSPNLSDDKKMKKGYVNRSLLHEAISQCHSGRWGDAKGTKIWLCGPPLMEKAMTGKEGVLASLGLTGNQVFIF